MQKDEEVGKVAQATPVVICELTISKCILVATLNLYTHSEGIRAVPRVDC